MSRLRSPGAIALLVTLGFLAALAVAYVQDSTYWMATLARMAALALSAVSLSFLVGQAGLVSFGHAAPVGIGAYAVLIAGEFGVREVMIVLPLAFAAAALFSALTGAIALRTRGVYFIMITLAFAQMAFYVAASLSAFGGDDGMAIAGRSTFLGERILRRDHGLALLAIGLLGVGLFVLGRVTASKFGLVLRAARDNETRVRALGLATYGHRLAALALAGGVAGLSGALLANQAEFVSPSYMNWHVSGQAIVMVALGGAGHLVGGVIGAVAVTLLDEAIGHYTEYWKLGLGLVVVGAALLRGRGLLRRIVGGQHD
ncbi:branched-chain amino acid ABC transporter permease [Azorhizobium oxalatiphilum]|nr:branched-chain amino acid ABC transporter permease [Azorhizobium oxalatiphilum]